VKRTYNKLDSGAGSPIVVLPPLSDDLKERSASLDFGEVLDDHPVFAAHSGVRESPVILRHLNGDKQHPIGSGLAASPRAGLSRPASMSRSRVLLDSISNSSSMSKLSELSPLPEKSSASKKTNHFGDETPV